MEVIDGEGVDVEGVDGGDTGCITHTSCLISSHSANGEGWGGVLGELMVCLMGGLMGGLMEGWWREWMARVDGKGVLVEGLAARGWWRGGWWRVNGWRMNGVTPANPPPHSLTHSLTHSPTHGTQPTLL